MPVRICTDKRLKRGQIRNTAGVCFKKGIKAGYAAGINTERKNTTKRKKAIEASAQAIVLSKYKTIPVENATNDLRKTYLKELNVPNYRAMSQNQTIQTLRNKGYNKIIVPRVR